jgi:nucleotide-binding universal stress UspA family protein
MQKVAKGAGCPVAIIARPCTTCWKLFSNIVIAVDFSKACKSAFSWASNLAKEVNSNLHIFHAVDLEANQTATGKPQEDIEQRIETAKTKIDKDYISKLKGFDKHTVEIWEGTPYVEILKFARERQADLIVMAHHTREIDPELALLGSTLEQVVLRSACPVASVNRPGKAKAV